MNNKDLNLLKEAYNTILENSWANQHPSELKEFHTEIDGINYYVGFTDEDGEISIHEIVPHEGQGETGDEPVFDIKSQDGLSPEVERIYNIAKERLEEEYGVSDEDRELPNEYNPFSRENPDF